MADDKDEKLITSALQTVFKNAKIPPELYERRQYELKVDDAEVVKVNMTLKRGHVLEIEDDSHFRTFLNINDIVLTVNDKVANKTDFKLHDLFKEKGCKSFVFTYVRMKWAPDDRPALDESERKDGYEYRVFALFHYQRVPIGIILQSFQGAKVMVMEVASKTIGSMCLQPGDCILQLNGVRQGNDAAKTLEAMATEIEQKGFARITIERPTSEVAKATAAFTIQTEHRDLPVPGDCAAYIKDAIKLLNKAPEPKSILKPPKQSGAEEATAGSRVGFHERIHAESVIPSDIADELLVKTPNRVPGVTIASPLQMQLQQPPTAPETDKEGKENSLMGKPPSLHAPPTPQKERKNKASKKSTAEPKKSGGRKKASAEVIKSSSKSGKSAAEGKGGKAKPKKKSKQGAAVNNTQTGGDTEGTGTAH